MHAIFSSAVCIAASSQLFAEAFECSQPWNDTCPPSGDRDDVLTSTLLYDFSARPGSMLRAAPGCLPYAPPYPSGTNYTAVREQFVNVAFGRTDGQLPGGNVPDAIEPVPGPQMQGCYCSYLGNCPASDCTWSNNMTKLTFTITQPVNASFTLSADSVVYWTLNTSGVAPATEWAGGASMPPVPMPATRQSDTLVLIHNGHNQPCNMSGCVPDYDGTADYLNQIGYDTMTFNMPGYACNTINDPSLACNHNAWESYLPSGIPIMRFFVEPVVRAINYAVNTLGYKRIAMTGLSGGGWTTTVMGALDTRIQLSVPVAGSMPCDFRHTSWDFEQWCNHTWFQVANYSSMYVLGALEPGRSMVQVNHEQDPCCFHGCGRHDRIRQYNEWVQGVTAGAFQSVITVGNVHEFNPRDKAVIANAVDRLQTQGTLTLQDLQKLPFNSLQLW